MSCTGQIPRIWVEKGLSRSRREHFMDVKFSGYVRTTNKHDVTYVFYHALIFKGFLNFISATDGVRIYLASYPDEGPADLVPPGLGGMMTFIFAPVNQIANTNHFSDQGTYYILNPGAQYRRIDKDVASAWVRNFQSSKLGIYTVLSNLADSDTKSVLFTKEQLRELFDEMTCQNASGIRLYLSSYLPNDPDARSSRHRRTTIQFMFTETVNGSQEDFYIDDRPGFPQRELPPVEAMDTGSPCPPDTCFGGSLPE